jgi:Transmembrane secretion effector
MLTTKPYLAVLREPAFRFLLPGFIVSSLGDGMSTVGVAWLALQLADGVPPGVAVAAAVASFTLPGAAGLALTPILAQVTPRRLMFLDASLRAVALGLVPILAITGALHLWVYIGLLAVSSLLHVWGVAGRRALVPKLLSEKNWFAANSLLVSQSQVMLVIGPGLAGIALQRLGPSTVLGFDALSYACLAALLVRSNRIRSRDETGPIRAASPVNLRTLLANRRITVLLSMTFVFYLLYGPLEVALPVYVASDLNADAGVLGLMWTGFGVGAIAGGLVLGTVRGLPTWPTLILIVMGWGLALLPLGLGHTVLAAVAAFAVGGFVYAPYTPLSATLVQQSVPRADVATASAGFAAALLIAPPLGNGLGAPLVDAVGAQATILLCSATTIALAVASGLVSAIVHATRRT